MNVLHVLRKLVQTPHVDQERLATTEVTSMATGTYADATMDTTQAKHGMAIRCTA